MPIIVVQLFLVAIIAYLWGSIPAGYWMGKLLRGKDFDIRDYGSRKIGATNVLRTLGRGPAAIVFIFDISKGFGPTLLALYVPFLNIMGWGPPIAGLAALLGHCFPIFIGFKGGRGVLTGAGATLIISPFIFLIALCLTWFCSRELSGNHQRSRFFLYWSGRSIFFYTREFPAIALSGDCPSPGDHFPL